MPNLEETAYGWLMNWLETKSQATKNNDGEYVLSCQVNWSDLHRTMELGWNNSVGACPSLSTFLTASRKLVLNKRVVIMDKGHHGVCSTCQDIQVEVQKANQSNNTEAIYNAEQKESAHRLLHMEERAMLSAHAIQAMTNPGSLSLIEVDQTVPTPFPHFYPNPSVSVKRLV